VAITYLVEGRFEEARESIRSANKADASLFDAHFVLAVLEQDAGRAPEALAAARKAEAIAPNDVARSALRQIRALVTPYAISPVAEEVL
jgi:Tfp pilus assembly protein PilF